MAKASVIIPVYNKEKYLEETLISVDKQTEDDLEVIIVDDASTDHSMDIVRDFAANTKKQVKIIKNDTNQGVAYSRNIGVEESKTDFVSFLDADDILDKYFMESMLSKFEKYPVLDSVVGSPILFNSESGDLARQEIEQYYTERVIVPSLEPNCIVKCGIGCTAKVFKKSSIQNLKFVESAFEDYEFFLCTMAENLNFWYTETVKYRYRAIPEGKYQTSLANTTSFLDNFEIYDRVEERYPNMISSIHKAIEEKQRYICLKHLDILLADLNMEVMDQIRFISNYLHYMQIRYSYMEGIPLSALGYYQKVSDDPEELKQNLKRIAMKY